MSSFCCFDVGLVVVGRRRLRPRSASPRRPGREGRGAGRCSSPSSSARKTTWLVLPGTASRLPARSGRSRCGRRRSSQFELDRGVDRDHQLVIGEGAVRVVVAPQPLLAGRLDHQRLGFLAAARPAAPVAGVAARLVGEDDAEDEDDRGEGGEHGADPELEPAAAGDLPRLGAPRGAVRADGGEQRDVDRDDDDRRGDEADPKQRVDLVGARRVRRQSAAILITTGGVEAARRRSGPGPTYTRRPYEEALPAIPAQLRWRVRAGAAALVGAAIAVPLLRRRLRIPAPVTVAACAAGAARRSPSCSRARRSATSPSSPCRCGPSSIVHELPYDDPERAARPPPHPLPDRRSTA